MPRASSIKSKTKQQKVKKRIFFLFPSIHTLVKNPSSFILCFPSSSHVFILLLSVGGPTHTREGGKEEERKKFLERPSTEEEGEKDGGSLWIRRRHPAKGGVVTYKPPGKPGGGGGKKFGKSARRLYRISNLGR